LPDKAIDVMDEAGSRARISALVRPPDIEGLTKEIEDVCSLRRKGHRRPAFRGSRQISAIPRSSCAAKQDEITAEWRKIA